MQEELDKCRANLRDAESRAEEAERTKKQLEHQIDMLESEKGEREGSREGYGLVVTNSRRLFS